MQMLPWGANPTTSHQATCPNCGQTVPVHPGFVTWCDACDWNVAPTDTRAPANAVEAVYRSLSRRWSGGLLREMLMQQEPRRSMTLATGGALVLALLVHAVTVGAALVGINLIVTGWPALLVVLGGVLCLGLAWGLAPRPRRAPDGEWVLTRADAPVLHDLVDEVCAKLGARPVQAIVAEPEVNAWVAQHGLLRRGVSLHLGLPLLAALEGDELVALLGHEVAHTVNGDPASGFVLGAAIDSLVLWRYVVQPHWDAEGLMWFAVIPVNLVAIVVGWLLEGYTRVLVQLAWRDSQRAEYLADYLAVGVAGGEAVRKMLEKNLFAPTVRFVVQRLGVGNNHREQGLFDALRQQLALVPQRELERRHRAAELDDATVDNYPSTHGQPPAVSGGTSGCAHAGQLCGRPPRSHPCRTPPPRARYVGADGGPLPQLAIPLAPRRRPSGSPSPGSRRRPRRGATT